MTSQNSKNRSQMYRVATGTLTGAALAFGLILGLAPTSSAQPTTGSAAPPAPRISPDQILAMISQEYQTGSGGGQVSKLIDQVMTLRARGIRPNVANTQALAAGLDARPNQGPLIEALQSTVSYQRKVMAQSQAGGQAPSGGAPPVNAPSPAGVPAWAPGSPLQQDGDTIFPMPGR